MELKISNRDYVPDGVGGLRRLSGTEELMQRVLYRLSVRRGSFPFDETLGSELHLLQREKTGNREGAAKKYVTEALKEEKGISVNEVSVADMGDELLQVTVKLDCDGENTVVSLTVGGEGTWKN